MPDWKNTLWTNPHLSISSVSTWRLDHIFKRDSSGQHCVVHL